MRVGFYVFISVCLATTTAAATQAGPFMGRFQGTGRACHGTLEVTAKAISWLTPFSQCKSMRYELIEQGSPGGPMRMTYRLKPATAGCRYAVLTLTHHGTVDGIGWEAIAYGSEKTYRTDKADGYKTGSADMVSCPLVRDVKL